MDANTITLRDSFAMQVVLAILSHEDQTGNDIGFVAQYAYQMADALLKERDKTPLQQRGKDAGARHEPR